MSYIIFNKCLCTLKDTGDAFVSDNTFSLYRWFGIKRYGSGMKFMTLPSYQPKMS
jgi:hypothetical protein